MNARKIEMRENRLNLVKDRVEARRKLLAARGLDEKQIKKDSTMRQLLAEARMVKRSIETIKREPPKAEQAEKTAKPKKPAKGAAQPKAPKPPKEKKPKKEEPPPPD
jgi:hypothetical protein